MNVWQKLLLGIGCKTCLCGEFSDDGMDEISLATTTQFAYVEGGIVSHGVIDPEAFGFKKAVQKAIVGGMAARECRAITRAIFAGTATDAQRDIVLDQCRICDSLQMEGQEISRKHLRWPETGIESGKATKHLENYCKGFKQIVGCVSQRTA